MKPTQSKLPHFITTSLWTLAGAALAGAAAYFLYTHGLFYLYTPLAIVFIIALCVIIWKRETKKDKARIARLYAEGILRHPREKPAIIEYGAATFIAAIISREDNTVVTAVEDCEKDHVAYFNNHRAEYTELGIESIEGIEKDELCWMNMIEQLTSNHYAVGIDWKLETEDILYNLNLIARKLRIPLDMEKLEITGKRIEKVRAWNDDDDSITWVALCEISSVLKTKGCALGNIEDGSDSYTLFLVPEDQTTKETLVKFANKYGRGISFNFERHRGPNALPF